ncbi:MAG TPA: methyltransferase domain-containing protein [Gammaproteobacteria bacterium]|nr:methyltransferase domain-containing protein [Gammaproteobacteria bacterium]
MNEQAKNKWNKIYADTAIKQLSVSRVLSENEHLLPACGCALDLACGTGSDAIFLANRGLTVDAWDISDAVIEKLAEYASDNALSIRAQARDINQQPPLAHAYDVITVAHFLERDLMSVLLNSLKPGGLIFYQTFTKTVTEHYSGPKNPDFRLATNELLDLFSALQLVVYREEALIGDIQQGFRNEVMYVGRRACQKIK